MGSFLSAFSGGGRQSRAIFTPPVRAISTATSPQAVVEKPNVSRETEQVAAVLRRQNQRLQTITTSERGVLAETGLNPRPQRKVLLGE